MIHFHNIFSSTFSRHYSLLCRFFEVAVAGNMAYLLPLRDIIPGTYSTSCVAYFHFLRAFFYYRALVLSLNLLNTLFRLNYILYAVLVL